MTAQIDAPNYTQTPNVILEVWMSKLSGAEFKVLMLIVRETFGYHRDWTKNKHATQAAIVTATGLSIGAVKLALTKLLTLGLIESRSTGKVGRGGQGLEYRLMVNGQPLTDNGYPIMDDAQPPAYGSTIDPPLYIQNKERVNKESLGGANDAPAANDPQPPTPRQRKPRQSKPSKPKADPTPKAPREPNPHFDAFCRAFGLAPDGGRMAGLAGEFAAGCKREGATLDQFRDFYREHKREWGKYGCQPHTLTATFLAWRIGQGLAGDPITGGGDTVEIDGVVVAFDQYNVKHYLARKHAREVMAAGVTR